MSGKGHFWAMHHYVTSLPVFSDHEHHLPDSFFKEGMSLDLALKHSYVALTGFVPDATDDSRRILLENVRFNSFFMWFEKGVQAIHGIKEPITLRNWDAISQKITAAYARDPEFHWRVLKKHKYEAMVQDAQWDPGYNNGHPELFKPAFRIDKFMYGYHSDAVAPNGFVPWQRYGFKGGRFEDYIELMGETILSRHRAGQIFALKFAQSYFRPIDFQPADQDAAKRAFGVSPDRITPEQKLAFGNYVFNRCCELAAELNIPIQIHTGLSQPFRPMALEPAILRFPRTQFVILHSGFPWTHEVTGLVHNHANVLPSLAWTVTLCTAAAIRTLHDFIDVARSINRITWGSDCQVTEESVGALLAWRFIVAKVLSERIDDGRLTIKDAKLLGRKLMFENGRSIYLKGTSGK